MASAPDQYPTTPPEELDVPLTTLDAPEQEVVLGYRVTHSRLWLASAGLLLALVASLTLNILQTVSYDPVLRLATLDHGYPVIVNDEGDYEIDGVVYRPLYLRQLVTAFIESRYGYHWRHLDRINRARAFMSPDALAEEAKKLSQVDLQERIVDRQAVYDLSLDLSNWEVEALGRGRFRVRVPGVAYITDNYQYTDPENPYPKHFNAEVVVETVPPSENNIYGYRVIETGRDIVY